MNIATHVPVGRNPAVTLFQLEQFGLITLFPRFPGYVIMKYADAGMDGDVKAPLIEMINDFMGVLGMRRSQSFAPADVTVVQQVAPAPLAFQRIGVDHRVPVIEQ